MSSHACKSLVEDGIGFCAHRLTCCKSVDSESDATNCNWEKLRWSCTRNVSSYLESVDCRCAEVFVNHEAELFRQVEEAKRLRHEDVQVVKLQVKSWKSGS